MYVQSHGWLQRNYGKPKVQNNSNIAQWPTSVSYMKQNKETDVTLHMNLTYFIFSQRSQRDHWPRAKIFSYIYFCAEKPRFIYQFHVNWIINLQGIDLGLSTVFVYCMFLLIWSKQMFMVHFCLSFSTAKWTWLACLYIEHYSAEITAQAEQYPYYLQ